MLSLHSCAATQRLCGIGDWTQNLEHTKHSPFITRGEEFTEKQWEMLLVVLGSCFFTGCMFLLHRNQGPSYDFLKPIFILICVHLCVRVLGGYVHVSAGACRDQRYQIFLELEFASDCELIVAGAGHQTRVLWKNNMCSTPQVWYLKPCHSLLSI